MDLEVDKAVQTLAACSAQWCVITWINGPTNGWI